MVWWCSSCGKTITRPDLVDGKICCPRCGKVIDEDNFSEEPTFVKNAAGQSQLGGNFVRTVQNISHSVDRRVAEAVKRIEAMISALRIADDMAQPAKRFFRKLLELNFTRRHKKEQVEAACLYVACRVNHKPHLLIDFSDYLRINVYKLGAVYLQLCEVLSLKGNPIVQNVVDPSLFIHRFANCLFGENRSVTKTALHTFTRTALHIVASMKRDWMQTGRKPSGLCGAALYISALSHGLECSKSDIIKAVHVCEATLTKRLIEFENTDSGGLTIEEFNMKAKEFEEDDNITHSLMRGSEGSGISQICVHKGSARLVNGLCESCYKAFMNFLGGLNGGSDPPAFQREENERITANEAAAGSSENLGASTLPGPAEMKSKLLKSDEERSFENVSEQEVIQPAGSDSTGATLPHKIIRDPNNDRVHAGDVTFEESESLSDIDDTEVDVYLHSEEEKQLKKIIWEEMNKEYVEEQAAKEAAALAAKKAHEASFSDCSEDVQAAQKLAAAAAEAVAKLKKERQQKRAEEKKNAGPPQNAAEATKRVLDGKRLSSKIRYDVLEKLFDESEIPEKKKKSRTEPKSDFDNNDVNRSKEDPELEGTEDTYIDDIEEYDYGDDGYNDFNDF